MNLTELKIAPRHSWEAVGDKNPLICVVKLASETATVETVLSVDDIARIMALVRTIVADAAKRNVDEFCAAVQAIEADKQKVTA